jgi:hypothetical protein
MIPPRAVPSSLFAAFFGVFTFVALPASAAPPASPLPARGERLLLVGDTEGELAAAVRAELLAGGNRIRLGAASERDDLRDVDAVVRLDASGGRAQIWTVDGKTHEPQFRHEVVSRNDGPTLGVRVSEALRVYASAGSEPTAAVADAPASAADSPTPEPIRDARPLSVALEGGLLASAGAPAQGNALLRIRYAIGRRFAVGVVGAVPFAPSSMTRLDQNATIATRLLGLELQARVLGAEGSRLQAHARVGVFAAFLHMTGTANRPFTSGEDDVATALPFVGPDVAYAIAPRFWLQASALVGTMMPAVGIRFGGSEVASLDAPVVALSSGLRFDL